MTILKHVYSVKELLNKGTLENNYAYSNLFIQHFLEIYRCYVLNRRIDRREKLQEYNYSAVCMELEMSTFQAKCESDDCLILKSKHPVPLFLANTLSVYYTNGEVISHRTINQNKYNKYSIQKEDKTSWFIFDNYLYIQNNLLLEKVILRGIFENLADVHTIDCNCNPNGCDEDYEFYVDPALIPEIYQMVLNNLIGFNDETKPIQPQSSSKNNQKDKEDS